jgi:hypothetical protein
MKIERGCHCGNITYRAEVYPNRVGICHCTDRQTLTGSPTLGEHNAQVLADYLSASRPVGDDGRT